MLTTTRLRIGAPFLVLVLVVGVLPMPVGAAPPSSPAPQSPGYTTQFGEVISTLTPTLQWGSVSGANNYHVAIRQYAGSWDSGPIVLDQGYIYTTSYNVPSGVLEAGESYRWNIRAFNSGGEASDWSSRLYFQTQSPSPVLNSASCSSCVADYEQHPLTLSGSNFVDGNTLTLWDPSNEVFQSVASKLTVNSASQITYQLNPGTDDGEWKVRVNSADGSQQSATRTFTVSQDDQQQPAPVLNSASCSSCVADSQLHTVTLTGSGFTSTNTLTFTAPGGNTYSSTTLPARFHFVSSSQITYEINPSTTSGTWSVRVNSADGSQHSATRTFTVSQQQQPPPAGSLDYGDVWWPVSGEIRRGFFACLETDPCDTFHAGIDVPGPLLSPVHASFAGTVRTVDSSGSGDYGKHVIIAHDDGMHEAVYGHLCRIDITSGSRVQQGAVIGGMGNTGLVEPRPSSPCDSDDSSGTHLHFEIRHQPIGSDECMAKPAPGAPAYESCHALGHHYRDSIPGSAQQQVFACRPILGTFQGDACADVGDGPNQPAATQPPPSAPEIMIEGAAQLHLASPGFVALAFVCSDVDGDLAGYSILAGRTGNARDYKIPVAKESGHTKLVLLEDTGESIVQARCRDKLGHESAPVEWHIVVGTLTPELSANFVQDPKDPSHGHVTITQRFTSHGVEVGEPEQEEFEVVFVTFGTTNKPGEPPYRDPRFYSVVDYSTNLGVVLGDCIYDQAIGKYIKNLGPELIQTGMEHAAAELLKTGGFVVSSKVLGPALFVGGTALCTVDGYEIPLPLEGAWMVVGEPASIRVRYDTDGLAGSDKAYVEGWEGTWRDTITASSRSISVKASAPKAAFVELAAEHFGWPVTFGPAHDRLQADFQSRTQVRASGPDSVEGTMTVESRDGEIVSGMETKITCHAPDGITLQFKPDVHTTRISNPTALVVDVDGRQLERAEDLDDLADRASEENHEYFVITNPFSGNGIDGPLIIFVTLRECSTHSIKIAFQEEGNSVILTPAERGSDDGAGPAHAPIPDEAEHHDYLVPTIPPVAFLAALLWTARLKKRR